MRPPPLEECLTEVARLERSVNRSGLLPEVRLREGEKLEIAQAHLSAARRGHYNYAEQERVTREGRKESLRKADDERKKAEAFQQRRRMAELRIMSEMEGLKLHPRAMRMEKARRLARFLAELLMEANREHR